MKTSRLGPGIVLHPIGWVESALASGEPAPRQPDEGAPEASLRLDPAVRPGLTGVVQGSRLVVITWLDRARREVLRVHPRDDATREERGVFATRSADRPNPIGLHDVEVIEVDNPRIRVAGLEAFDGTPILDIKPVLGPVPDR